MIPSVIIYLLALLLDALNQFLPNWTIWNPAVERGLTLFGGYCYWLDPWIPMATFWQIVLYNAALIMVLLPLVIFSRTFRAKIFKQ